MPIEAPDAEPTSRPRAERPTPGRTWLSLALLQVFALLGSVACSPEYYRDSADAEAHALVASANSTEQVPAELGEAPLEGPSLDVRTVGLTSWVDDYSSVPSPPSSPALDADSGVPSAAPASSPSAPSAESAASSSEAAPSSEAVPSSKSATSPDASTTSPETPPAGDAAELESTGTAPLDVEDDAAAPLSPLPTEARSAAAENENSGGGGGANPAGSAAQNDTSDTSDTEARSDPGAILPDEGSGDDDTSTLRSGPPPSDVPSSDVRPSELPSDPIVSDGDDDSVPGSAPRSGVGEEGALSELLDESLALGDGDVDQLIERLRSEAADLLAASAQGLPGATKVAARLISLADALRLAFANNREIHDAREAVYRSALDLSLAQHQFAPRFLGVLSGDFGRSSNGEESGGFGSAFTWNQLFASGARLSVRALSNATQFFTGNRREVAQNIFSATVTQPLLQGFGSEIVEEPLIQAERSLRYQVRSFQRFRQTLAVSVISEYYRVLEVRDRITNEYFNWASLVRNRERVVDLSSAGRIERLEVDQARQQELQAEARYASAVASYEGALDSFKVTLGIPVEEQIHLDPRELSTLVERGVESLPTDVETAVAAATVLRVDWKTARDRLEDAERRIVVRRDGLRAQLDVSAEAGLASGDGQDQKPFKFNANDYEYGVGFTLDLPFDRKAERNAYVESLIDYRSQQRELTLFEDNLRVTIRDALLTLEREIVNFPIQRQSVDLAQERVVSTTVLRQAGRASTRDVLESQDALIDARNALTSSLVSYTLARLSLYRDVGALRVSPEGSLTEQPIEAEIR
jgi:outer membrane protein TolC